MRSTAACFLLLLVALAALTGCGATRRGGAAATLVTVTSVACDGTVTRTQEPAPSAPPSGGVTALGTVPGGSAGGRLLTPPPFEPPPLVRSGVLRLSDADTGATEVVRPGVQIIVRLGPAAAPFCWSAPRTSDGATVAQLSSAFSDDRTANAVFVARRPGTAQLTATMDPHCLPACGVPSALWMVTVEVRL